MYCYIRFDESKDEQKYSGNQAAKNDIWYECKVCLKMLHTYIIQTISKYYAFYCQKNA